MHLTSLYMNYPICKMGKITDLGELNELSIQRRTQSNTLDVNKNEALNSNSLLLLVLFLKVLRVDWAWVVHAEGLRQMQADKGSGWGCLFFSFQYLFAWLQQVLAVAHGILPLA